MAELLFLSRSDVEAALEMDPLFQALERAFQDLSAGRASVPPRVAAVAPGGMLAAMPGYLPGVALEAKLVSIFPRNNERGISSHHALIALFDEGTGEPIAVMDGTYITAVRTGAASAIAARAVARSGVRTLAILGGGVQGGSHMNAFIHAFDLEEIRVASRNLAHAEELAARVPIARSVVSFEAAVRGADVVCCCTDSPEPVLEFDWLSPGAHVSSVGTGAELDPATIAEGSVFVEWRGAVENPPPAGARELQGLDPRTITEVGEVLSGSRPGRRSDQEVTVYKSTGHAVEDAAAARLVYDRGVQLC